MDSFVRGEFDHVDVSYAKFKNAATQFFNVAQFLRVTKVEVHHKEEGKGDGYRADYILSLRKKLCWKN